MAGEPVDGPVSDYRLSPTHGARLVGGLLIGLAVLLFVATALVGWLGLPADLLVVLALLGVAGVQVAGYLLTRRVSVVPLTPRDPLHAQAAVPH